MLVSGTTTGEDGPHTPLGQVRFGAHNDTRDLIHSTEIDDLVVHNLDHFERLSAVDGVDEHIAVDANCMLRVEDRVLVLQNASA